MLQTNDATVDIDTQREIDGRVASRVAARRARSRRCRGTVAHEHGVSHGIFHHPERRQRPHAN